MAQSSLITVTGFRSRTHQLLRELIDIFDTSTGHTHDGTDSALLSATGNTLDQSYDQGGAGSGRSITVDSGAVAFTNNAANTNGVLTIGKSPAAAQAGDGIVVTMGANATGAGISFANTGSGNDITGTAGWNVTKAGVGTFDSLSVGQMTMVDDTLPAGTSAYIGRDNTGDVTINALVAKEIHLAIAGTDVADISASGLEVISGGLTVTAGGLTVSASGATITGNSTVTGNLTVTGDLTFGGNWTVGATLTVDELILDTDGIQPAGTNVYVVRDNTGDMTVNAVTGKQFIVAINNTDEYTFSATILDMNANALDNAGFIILNAATQPDATEVYLVNDNTGDLTINALTGKAVHVAVNGVDEFNFTGTAFQVTASNNIQFLGNNGLIDSNGNEVILVEAVAGATTYLNVKNANGAAIELETLGAADLGMIFKNDQDEELLILTPVASAVNELTLINAATTARPIVRTTGEGDIGIQFQNLAGEIMFATLSTATPLNWIEVSNANTGARPFFVNPGEDDIGMEFRAKNNEEMLILATTAAAVNEITITAQAASSAPSIAATGGDAAIDLSLLGKGAGYVRIDSNLDMSDNTLFGSQASGGDLILSSTGHATKGDVRILTGNVGLKIGGTVDRAGTVGDNALHIFNGAAAPAGTLANGITLYSEAGECKVLDAAGNSTTLSPHTDDGDYVIHSYSALKDETVTIHVEKLLKALANTPQLSRFVKVTPGHATKPEMV